MSKKRKTKLSARRWYNRRGATAGLGLVGLGLAYVLGLRALSTGSLQQYFLTIVLLCYGISRLAHAARRSTIRHA